MRIEARIDIFSSGSYRHGSKPVGAEYPPVGGEINYSQGKSELGSKLHKWRGKEYSGGDIYEGMRRIMVPYTDSEKRCCFAVASEFVNWTLTDLYTSWSFAEQDGFTWEGGEPDGTIDVSETPTTASRATSFPVKVRRLNVVTMKWYSRNICFDSACNGRWVFFEGEHEDELDEHDYNEPS